MGDESDLLIKINADAANATKAFDDIRDKTSDLEGTLSTVALVSGVAFAALTAEVFLSVSAFEDAQKSSVELSTALQNQGIFSEELKNQYIEYAEAASAATGVDSASIEKSQAIAQSYLGQMHVTGDLTNAIVDLAAKMGGDLNGAAEKIARTIGTGTNAFARQGLVIDSASTEAERYTKVLAFVQSQAGGLAAQFNEADGYATALTTAFKEFQVQIGANFAPIISAARQAAAEFFTTLKNNPIIIELATAVIAAGLAVSGLATAIAIAVPAFLALSAAAAVFGTTVAVVAPWLVAIGLLVAGVTLLALNWDKSMAAVKAAAQGAVTLISELFTGLGKVLEGAFTLDPTKIKEGLDQITASFSKAKDATIADYQAITSANKKELVTQDADKKEFADKQEALRQQQQSILIQIRQAEIQQVQLVNEHASADLIKLKGEELSTLKALQKTQDTTEIAALQTKVAQIRALEAQQAIEDKERQTAYGQAAIQTQKDLAAQGIQVQSQLNAQQIAQLTATAKSKEEIDRDVQTTLLTNHIKENNQYLLDQKKFGDSYAALNKATHTQEVQDAESLASQMSALQNSKSDELKAIGKAAAIADIGIKTAQGAVAAEALSISAFGPIAGPIIGTVMAAALIAYGAEQVATILGFSQGGLVEGGVAGQDSVLAALQPGELVVPQKNFDQVVGAVQGQGGDSDLQSQMAASLQSIDSKFSAPQTNIIQGDVSTDKSFIDSLCKQISDALEFRNAKIYGVNIGRIGASS